MIRRWRIRNRIVFLSMFPMVAIALTLGGVFTHTRLADLDRLLLERGLATTRQLSSAAEYGLLTNNQGWLANLATAALEERDIRSVAIYGDERRLLVRAGPRQVNDAKLASSLGLAPIVHQFDNVTRIVLPIRPQDTLFRGSQAPPALAKPVPADRVIGWVVLELSHAGIRLQKYQTLVTSIALILLALIANWLIAQRMSRDIIRPISQMAEAVTAIKEGKLDTRVYIQSSPELHQLEAGINSMAESLKKAYDEMQQNVDQATEDLRETLETIEIQNIELDMARKEALEASRIKSEFLANMSHEIRTPLNGIIGFTNLLLRSEVNPQQHDYLKTIQKSSEILLTIINDILDFSKIEAGKLVLDRTPFRLREIIEDVLTMLAPAAHQKNLDLAALIYADVPKRILGDPLRIKQIITNLVNNGIKFTQSGEVVVRAMLEDSDGNRARIRISVSDTGVGLSRVQQQSLFTAFSQADASTARRFGGTGLGLVISKRLVEQMDGEIGLESELGKGSTFWFALPTEVVPPTSEDDDLEDLASARVIYLETQAKTGLAVGHMLEDWGIELERVDAPDTLLEKVAEARQEQREYAVALLGIHRHLLDSTQYKQLVRDLEVGQNCRVLLLTPTLDVGDRQLPLVAASSAQLTKPVRHDRLYQALYHLIRGDVADQADQEEQSARILPSASSDQTLADQLRILAVDDNPANLKLIETFLKDMGADTDTATSGFEALSKVKQYRYDLIFMDVQMPGMDGVETTQRIRQLEPGRHTPIIALTAHALAEEKQHLLQSGFDDYLTKPIDDELLARVILYRTGHRLTPPSQPESSGAPSLQNRPPRPMPRSIQGTSVDVEESVRLAGGKNVLAEELFAMLLDHLEEDYQVIEGLWSRGERDQLLERVHRLHGATRYCGVPALRQLAGSLETDLKRNQTDVQRRVQALLAEIRRIQLWSRQRDWRRDFRNYEATTAKAKT